MFDPAPSANDWYEVPKKTGKVFFTEPYNFPIDGKPVLMASLVAPILVGDKFQGMASADFTLNQLGKILADLKLIQSGQLALASNGGLYASHPNAEQVNKKAGDIPEAGLELLKKARPTSTATRPTTYILYSPWWCTPTHCPGRCASTFPTVWPPRLRASSRFTP